jgi:hypothetical protein
MVAVEWLAEINDENGASLVLPRFEAHNGASAKRRAMEKDRKQCARMSAKTSASDADKNGTREEKRREEKSIKSGAAKTRPAAITPTTKTRAKPATLIPDPFEVSGAMRAWAAERVPGVPVDHESEKFVNHYRAKGERRADWVASWRNWLLKAEEFAAERGGRQRNGAALDLDDLTWRENMGGL